MKDPTLVIGQSIAAAGVLCLGIMACTAGQLRVASVLVGAASRLACTGAVVALDLPGWSGTVCQEAASLVSEALNAEASRQAALADAGADAGRVAALPMPSAMAFAGPHVPAAPACVSVVVGGQVVGSACRRAAP